MEEKGEDEQIFFLFPPPLTAMDFLKLPERMGGMGTISHEDQLHEVSFS